MKHCPKCVSNKPLSRFSKNRAKADGLQNYCKDCAATDARAYYAKDKDAQKKRVARINAQKRSEVHDFMWDFYSSNPCVDCGESDPVVLQTDHQRDKVKAVSYMVANRWSLNRIKEELEKCEVRCANCHSRRTGWQQRWYKSTENYTLQ